MGSSHERLVLVLSVVIASGVQSNCTLQNFFTLFPALLLVEVFNADWKLHGQIVVVDFARVFLSSDLNLDHDVIRLVLDQILFLVHEGLLIKHNESGFHWLIEAQIGTLEGISCVSLGHGKLILSSRKFLTCSSASSWDLWLCQWHELLDVGELTSLRVSLDSDLDEVATTRSTLSLVKGHKVVIVIFIDHS